MGRQHRICTWELVPSPGGMEETRGGGGGGGGVEGGGCDKYNLRKDAARAVFLALELLHPHPFSSPNLAATYARRSTCLCVLTHQYQLCTKITQKKIFIGKNEPTEFPPPSPYLLTDTINREVD